MRLYTEDEKVKRIKRETSRLRKLYKELPTDKRAAAEGLIQEVGFMRATLEEARAIIDREGILERFEQGEQKFQREHPATKVYNTMINRYAGVCKQLIDLLPDGDAKKQGEDELMAFVKRGRR